jgi:hypothetical protein
VPLDQGREGGFVALTDEALQQGLVGEAIARPGRHQLAQVPEDLVQLPAGHRSFPARVP